jgi:cytochrome b
MTHEHTQSRDRIAVWDVPVRLFHWSLVAAIAVAFLSSEEDSILASWHIAAGWIAAILVAFRLSWGFIGSRYARFSSFVRPAGVIPHLRGLLAGKAERSVGHNPLGGMAVLALLGGTAAVVWTGIRLTGAGGSEELHETIAFGLLGLIVVHVIGVIVMSVMTRDNLVRAMVTGTKPAAGLAPQPRERHRVLAGLLGVMVIGLSVLGVLRYDPAAFQPGSREEGEMEEHQTARIGETLAPIVRHEDDDDD